MSLVRRGTPAQAPRALDGRLALTIHKGCGLQRAPCLVKIDSASFLHRKRPFLGRLGLPVQPSGVRFKFLLSAWYELISCPPLSTASLVSLRSTVPHLPRLSSGFPT
jgi:hypothetical protein